MYNSIRLFQAEVINVLLGKQDPYIITKWLRCVLVRVLTDNPVNNKSFKITKLEAATWVLIIKFGVQYRFAFVRVCVQCNVCFSNQITMFVREVDMLLNRLPSETSVAPSWPLLSLSSHLSVLRNRALYKPQMFPDFVATYLSRYVGRPQFDNQSIY